MPITNFKEKDGGLICPWCPPDPKGKTIFIQQCMHNPFKLMKQVRELQNELHSCNRASHILEELRDWINNGN